MTQNTITEAQSITAGSTVIISGRKFTTEFYAHDAETVYLAGARGGAFFLRGFLNAPGYFQVIALNSGAGEPLRNKAGEKLEVFLIGATLTDMTGVKRVK